MRIMPSQSYYADSLDQRSKPAIENYGALSPYTKRRLMETISPGSPASERDQYGYDEEMSELPERPATPSVSFDEYWDTRRQHVEGNVESVSSSRKRPAMTAIPYDIE